MKKERQYQSWSCGHCRRLVVLGQYLTILGQYRAVWVGTGWYWVSIRQHQLVLVRYWFTMWPFWLVLGGSRPVYGGTGLPRNWSCWVSLGRHLLVPGQYRAFMHLCNSWNCGDMVRCYRTLTDRHTRKIELLLRSWRGALLTFLCRKKSKKFQDIMFWK